MQKTTVLFVCIHNSARSQMAEAFLNLYGEDRFHAESAGIEPGKLNPFVVRAMAEEGIDISGNATKSVQQMIERKKSFDYVVTVCDPAAAEQCPFFPGETQRLHWAFEDPSSFQGSDEEKLAFARNVRDGIKSRIKEFVEENKKTDSTASQKG